MYRSNSVANRFLALAEERNGTLTPMQLLKLVYIAHGWCLGLYGVPLIREEVEAWQYGPVIRPLYNDIRQFKSRPVEGPLPRGAEALDEFALDLTEQVYDIYGELTGPALSRITHANGTPWARTYEHGVFGTPIPNDLIEDHYARKAAEGRAAS